MSINDNGIVDTLKENPQNGFRMLMAKYQENVYWRILFQVFLCPFFLLWGEMGKRACLEELDQSCMYQFIARLASDIAADKLTVHMFLWATVLIWPFTISHVMSIDFAHVPMSTWWETRYLDSR